LVCIASALGQWGSGRPIEFLLKRDAVCDSFNFFVVLVSFLGGPWHWSARLISLLPFMAQITFCLDQPETMAAPPSSTRPAFRYLSAWFCPFAHRATLALEHHRGRVDYEWVEALGWFQQDDAHNVTGTGKEWYYHWKADEVRRGLCVSCTALLSFVF
jgi:hypothetical protein